MKKFLLVLMLLFTSSSFATEVTINNYSNSKASFAFAYLDSTTNKFVVEGWYNVKANASSIVNLNTDENYYYLYAEFSNGNVIKGADNNIGLFEVVPESFYYFKDSLNLKDPRKVSFVKANATNKKANINIQ